MKKSKKIALCLLVIVVAISFVVVPVYASNASKFPTGNGSIGKVEAGLGKIWGTATTVVQILAFAAIVFAGVRYMFASADQRADLKKGLLLLVIGSVLVFGASMVVKFVVGAAGQIVQ